MMISRKYRTVAWTSVLCLSMAMTPLAYQSAVRESPRSAVAKFFELLKAGQYTQLYQYLPSGMQNRMTPAQLDQSLSRLQNFLLIDRIIIGKTSQTGDSAVVETTIFGQLKRPLKLNGATISEGRVIAQQIVAREEGQWKLITADNRTLSLFLKEHPDFKDNFRLTEPQLSFKQDGKWVPLSSVRPGLRRTRPPEIK